MGPGKEFKAYQQGKGEKNTAKDGKSEARKRQNSLKMVSYRYCVQCVNVTMHKNMEQILTFLVERSGVQMQVSQLLEGRASSRSARTFSSYTRDA
jgi:hypothetical protein